MRLLVVAICLGALTMASPVYCEVRNLDVEFKMVAESTSAGELLYLDVAIPAGVTPEAVFFADVNFDGVISPGTELQIWPQVSGALPAWDDEELSARFGGHLWIVDERTGPRVRFDITDLVRAWLSAEIPNLGVVIRTDVDLMQNQPTDWSAVKNLTASAYVLPVVVEGARPVVAPPGRPVGRGTVHDQGGR